MGFVACSLFEREKTLWSVKTLRRAALLCMRHRGEITTADARLVVVVIFDHEVRRIAAVLKV